MLTYSADENRTQQNEQAALGNPEHERVRDQSYIKQYNLQTVMAILKKHQPISRTDIARMTGMSPTSVTRIVNALLSHGLIHESAVSAAESEKQVKRGRRAVYLRVQKNGLYAVGVHLEKSMVRLCVTNFDDNILYCVESLVDGECTPEKMAQEAKKLFDQIPAGIIEDENRIGAVGVSLSGSVNNRTGRVKYSRNLGWEDVSVKEAFEKAFSLPAYVENEVKACLIGEKVRMDIRDEIDTVYLHFGDEVGAAIVSNGTIVRGRQNEAGNISGISVKHGADKGDDCLWMHLTEAGLVQRAQQKDAAVCTLDALLGAYDQRQEWAHEIVGDFMYHFAKTVRMICGLFDPQKIILGGKLAQKARRYIEAQQIDERICFGGANTQSSVSGAALIALREAVIERIGQSAE